MSDARWNDPREYGQRKGGDERPRVYDERDRDDHDRRDALMCDLDLPAPVPSGEREQGGARRRIRRRAGTLAADAGLHAVSEGSDPSRLGQRRAEANERTTEQERRVKVIQEKLDRLDEAFLYSESIDLTSYSRQRDTLREELTLAKIEQPHRSSR